LTELFYPGWEKGNLRRIRFWGWIRLASRADAKWVPRRTGRLSYLYIKLSGKYVSLSILFSLSSCL